MSNLRWLIGHKGIAERIVMRLPLIPEYNTPDHVSRSRAMLAQMGAINFDEFEYRT